MYEYKTFSITIHPKVEDLHNHYHFWMIMHLPKLDVLYGPILDESEVVQNWMFCTIHFGMILITCKKVNLKVILLQENNQTTKGYITDAKHVD